MRKICSNLHEVKMNHIVHRADDSNGELFAYVDAIFVVVLFAGVKAVTGAAAVDDDDYGDGSDDGGHCSSVIDRTVK